jgi:hypothetical protein
MNGTYSVEPYEFYNPVTKKQQSGSKVIYYNSKGEYETEEEFYGPESVHAGYEPTI